MSMRDRWTSDLHGGSPNGLPSSKFACLKAIIAIILLVGFGECASDLTKCVPWVPEDIFFFYRCWWLAAKPLQRGAKCRGERAFNINPWARLFHLRYFENGPLEPGYKVCSLPKKKKSNMLSTKRSRPALTYQELLSNFIFPLYLDNSARICSACRTAQTSSKYKESAETFVDVSKHFQPSLFWNGKGTHILKKILQILASGLDLHKSQCSVHQWINNMFYNFPGTFKLQN